MTPSGASLGRGASAYLQEELPSLCPEQEGHQEFSWLSVQPSRNLFVRKEGFVCRGPSSANLGRWVSAKLQGEPLSLYGEVRQGFPWLFYTTLALPFRSEGGVEYARLPSMGASVGISGELLSGKSEWRPMPHSIGVG